MWSRADLPRGQGSTIVKSPQEGNILAERLHKAEGSRDGSGGTSFSFESLLERGMDGSGGQVFSDVSGDGESGEQRKKSK